MTTRSDLLRDLAARYVCWRSEAPPSEDRIIAQVIELGTWDDIRRLEAAFAPDELRAAMLRAAPGWIGERSWSFCRGRLLHAGAGPTPEEVPRRKFDAAAP